MADTPQRGLSRADTVNQIIDRNWNGLTDAQMVAAAGRALFGDDWQQDTARLLGWRTDGRANRRIQYIAAAAADGEDYRIAPGVLADLAEALELRAKGNIEVARALRRRA